MDAPEPTPDAQPAADATPIEESGSFDWEVFFEAAWPWIWPILIVMVIVIAANIAMRKGLKWLQRRAATTDNAYDDVLIPALKRPLTMGILAMGLNIFGQLSPLAEDAERILVLITKGVITLTIVLAVDAVVQTWMAVKTKDSRVLATSGGVLRMSARVIVLVVGGLMVLSSLGINVTPIMASLGVGSLAIGLALQKTLEDFFSGLLLAADQPFRVGDFIEVDKLAGAVLSIGWRSARIQTRDRMYVIVPNSILAQSKVINRSFPDEHVLFTCAVGVGYESDLAKVGRVLTEVAHEVHGDDPRASPGHQPVALMVNFGDSSLDFVVWCSARSWPEHFGLKDVMLRAIRKRFDEEGINIPFPIRTLDVPRTSVDQVARLVPPAQLTARAEAPASGD